MGHQHIFFSKEAFTLCMTPLQPDLDPWWAMKLFLCPTAAEGCDSVVRREDSGRRRWLCCCVGVGCVWNLLFSDYYWVNTVTSWCVVSPKGSIHDCYESIYVLLFLLFIYQHRWHLIKFGLSKRCRFCSVMWIHPRGFVWTQMDVAAIVYIQSVNES